MKKMTGNQVRQAFLDFFKEKNHMIEPGAPLVPINDPTLLWINSGVAALKKYFDGSVTPLNNRISNAQKSIRTNDIENVGKTARHHTFFEMLGNFSIGDYFKEDAISYAWEFLTSEKWMGFDKEKIYVSVHPEDVEAYDIWVNKIGFPKEKILKTDDNFWQIGDGPCGPNSELFYDRGEKYDPEGLGEKLFFEELENDRYVEIWNVVFSQYDGKEGVARKDYLELPQKNIDTGMGLERLVSIVQEGETNFDTDLFLPIIKKTEEFATVKYGYSEDMAYRVIADHIRTVTFALSDGALFANEGRGYVLRRVLRRAVRFGLRIGIKKSFMYQLVEIVAKNMNDFYPYLMDKVEYVSKLVKAEEDRFHLTLNDGESLLNNLINNADSNLLKGENVFKLYDTYGFPLELTMEIAGEKGFDVDVDGFKECMEVQRERARSSRENIESMNSQSIDLMNFKEASDFVGYYDLTIESTVVGLFKNGIKVESLSDEGDIVFKETVFYAESGGQVADSGTISNPNFKATVNDVKKAPLKQHLVHVVVENGTVKLGDKVKQKVDLDKRLLITKHHSSAHLLQSALRVVLGEHISQAGSYVCDEYMRFDFTHYQKPTEEELQRIELLVNQYIEKSRIVEIQTMGIEQAKESGAIALFDEKYGDNVRTVKMGDVSFELCGGSHVNNTAEIGAFKIISEESIGSGIRRITGCVNIVAYREFKKDEELLIELTNLVKAGSVKQLKSKLNTILNEVADLKLDNAKMKEKLVKLEASSVLENAKANDICKVLIVEVDNDIKDLKGFVTTINDKLQGIVFGYQVTDKVVLACSCSALANAGGYKAGAIIKEAATICEGNGGGRDDLAQAGGKNINNVEKMLDNLSIKLGL